MTELQVGTQHSTCGSGWLLVINTMYPCVLLRRKRALEVGSPCFIAIVANWHFMVEIRQVPVLGNFVCSVLKENDEVQQERLVLVLELHVNGSQFSFRPIMLIECSLRSSGPKSQSCKQLNPKRI